jgi:hypothetical protein
MADTLSCQRETLHSQQLRSIKKSIDSDHGIYREKTLDSAGMLGRACTQAGIREQPGS